MAVWRCANCINRLIDEKEHPCKICDGKSAWRYYDWIEDPKNLLNKVNRE